MDAMERSPAGHRLFTAITVAAGLAMLASVAFGAPTRPNWLASLRATAVDTTAMDAGADPCADFYRFACGAWQDAKVVPKSGASYFAAFDAAQAGFRADMRSLLAANANGPDTSEPLRAAGQLAALCDATLADSATTSALPDFVAPADMVGLAAWVIRLQKHGVHPFFRWAVEPDLRDGQRAVLWVDEPPLGLGSREAYLAPEPAMARLRLNYLAHVRAVLTHFGVAAAADAAQAVLAIETRLAQASKPASERRNAQRMFNPMSLARLSGIAPSLPWSTWRAALGTGDDSEWIVTSPGLVQEINSLWQAAPLVDLVAYVQWTIARDALPMAGAASARLADQWQHGLTGEFLPSAADRCLDLTLQAYGGVLITAWLERKAGSAWQREMAAVWVSVRVALVEQLAVTPWLDAPAKAVGRAKLAKTVLAPWTPPLWQIDRGDGLLATRWSVRRQRHAWELAQIGRAPEMGRSEPVTGEAGAYFDPQRNVIVVSPALVQAPLWSTSASHAVRFGGLGAMLGHEAIHAVDREGGHFDATGTLRPWWTGASEVGLASAATCLSGQLARDAVPVGGRVNASAVLAEVAADLGGLRAAHTAMRQALSQQSDLSSADRAFFVAYAQAWCAVLPGPTERDMLLHGPHPPPRTRVHAAVRNLPAFGVAFACKPGAPLAPKTTCTLW